MSHFDPKRSCGEPSFDQLVGALEQARRGNFFVARGCLPADAGLRWTYSLSAIVGEFGMPLEALTPIQAVRAVGLFYDLLPGAEKPSRARIESVAGKLRDKAPDEAQPAIEGIFAPQNEEARGELALLILERLSKDDSLKPYVNQAVARAAKPDMAIDPLSLTAILAVLVFLSPTIEKDGDKVKYTSGLVATLQQLHVDEIARRLPAILKALPQSILEKLQTGP
jgi:hypothetical protein